MIPDKDQKAFLTLLKAGLWEKEAQLLSFDGVDFTEVYKLVQEQSVVGLVAAGLEYVKDTGIPKETMLAIAGTTLQIEQRNLQMNEFISDLICKLKGAGVYSLLVKGQGIAQCYHRPLWRVPGDIDLLLDTDNYRQAKAYLTEKAARSKREGLYSQHLGLSIGPWSVELHGTLRSGLSSRVDRVIVAVQRDTFENGDVRVWKNGSEDILLPGADNDLFLVFTHFIKHFYKEEVVCLRQVCDLCRLIWTFKDELDGSLLQDRLKKSSLLTEWKAFAALAVDYLGMPAEALPRYDAGARWHTKGGKMMDVIMRGARCGLFRRLFVSFWAFPLNTLRFLPGIVFNVTGLKVWERVMKR